MLDSLSWDGVSGWRGWNLVFLYVELLEGGLAGDGGFGDFVIGGDDAYDVGKHANGEGLVFGGDVHFYIKGIFAGGDVVEVVGVGRGGTAPAEGTDGGVVSFHGEEVFCGSDDGILAGFVVADVDGIDDEAVALNER